MMKYKVITIDGPAGSGKSTLAKLLAKRLGWRKLDTGAIYRSLALLALQNNISWDDEDALAKLAENMHLEFQNDKVLLNGKDVSQTIRTPQISEGASKVSVHPKVRKALLPIQRQVAVKEPCVAEGRDTGTVVFPEAPLKFYLTASVEERARRRFNELKQRGEQVSFEEVLKAEQERDQRDRNRKVAPLRKPEDAVEIDSTNLSIEQVLEIMLEHARHRGLV